MSYHHLTAEERFLIVSLRRVRVGTSQIAELLGRHRTTLWREVRRNTAPSGCGYGPVRAHEKTLARRKRSRSNGRFGRDELARVEEPLLEKWSPEQISGRLHRTRALSISHETIYRHVWRDMEKEALCTLICVRPSSSVAKGMGATIPEADSPGSG